MPTFTLSATVLGSPDPRGLAAFYRDLLGWQTITEEDGWVMLRPAEGGTGLSFQEEVEHTPPVWPAVGDDQQMQAHLDIRVDELEPAVERALALGALEAEFQPQVDVRVMLDPAGHPFCLFVD